MRKLLILISFFLLFLGSCGLNQRTWVHPLKENFAGLDSLVTREVQLTETGNDLYPDFPEIGRMDSVFSFQEIPGAFYPSIIEKFDFGSDGLLYMTDKKMKNIAVLNRKSEKVYTIGREGRGPGEFIQLVTFDFSEDYSRLYVLVALDIEIFKREGNTYVYERTLYHNMLRAYDMCAMNGRLYVSGYRVPENEINAFKERKRNAADLTVSGPILTFDVESEVQTDAFGYMYEANTEMKTYSGMLSKSMLDCNTTTNTIVSQFQYFPYMIGYDPGGDIKWVNRFENFRSAEAIEEQNKERGPTLRQYSNEAPFDSFLNFREMNTGKYSVIQQHVLAHQEAPAAVRKEIIKKNLIKTVLINSETGETSVKTGIPYLLGSKGSTLLIADRKGGTFNFSFFSENESEK